MKITELKSEGLNKSYKVVIENKEFAKEVNAKLAKLAKQVKIQGFRTGKAPLAMVKKKYQSEVMSEALDEAIRNGSNRVMLENKLRPATQPAIKIVAFGEDKDVEFDMDVEVLPEIKLGDFSKISLDKYVADVPAEEVEKAVSYLANARKETTVVDGKAAQKGDTVMIDFVGSVDGVEFNGGKGDNYPLELGSGSFIPGFEDQLVGAKAGDKVDVKVKFPENYHAKDLAGKDSVFAVSVKEVREPKAVEINDELAKSLGVESLEKLKENLTNRIKADYDNASKMKLKRHLLDALDKEYKFDVPNSLVEAEYKAIVEQYEQAKKYNQLDEDEKSKKEADLLKEYKDIAVRRVKLGLLLSEVGQDAKVTIKPEDINVAIMNEAKKYPGQEQMVLDYYLKNKQAVEALKAPIFEEKIIDHVISIVKLNEKKVSVEELYKFDEEKKTMDVDLVGEDMGILIGKRGQTLDSLQYLLSLVVNKESEDYIKVKLDTENYRERRKETLENLAKNIAIKVKRTRRQVVLEPMNPYERRIIHSALQNDKFVETHSEGEEPYRKVVVTPKKGFKDYNDNRRGYYRNNRYSNNTAKDYKKKFNDNYKKSYQSITFDDIDKDNE